MTDPRTTDPAADATSAAVTAGLDEAARLYYSAPADAVRLADEALALLGDAGPPHRRCRALVVRGNALSYAGRYADCLATLQDALALVAGGDFDMRADVLRALSAAHEEAGALDTALHWGVQAVEAARRAQDASLLVGALVAVAVVVSRNGDAEAGLRYMQEVLALVEAAGDPLAIARALNNMGINAKNLGRHAEALAHLQRSIAIAETLGDHGHAAVAATNLPEPLRMLGRLDEARSALHDAVRRSSGIGYVNAEAYARVQLGEFLLSQGEPLQAQAELEHALALMARGTGRSHQQRAHKALHALHKAAGRYEQALTHHEAYHDAERALFNEESGRRLRSLQVQYDLARAQQEAQSARLESSELMTQTRTDPLTGLANRRHLDQRLAAEVVRAQRQGQALAVALLDVDDFKQVNDRCGHATGDAVLRAVALLLRQHCRQVDTVARYGGEEFCLLMLDADLNAALQASESLRKAVGRHDWSALDPALAVTLSIGVAALGAGDTPQTLLAAADERLYTAKRGGKNRVA